MPPRPTKEKLEDRARVVDLAFEPINRHYSGRSLATNAAPWALVDTNYRTGGRSRDCARAGADHRAPREAAPG